MGDGWTKLKSTLNILSNVTPKVDVLGPEIDYVPKKLQINNPLPNLKNVKYKIDNEGLNIIHLPKEVKVNKGVPKFENLKTRIDSKGLEIFHGTPKTARSDYSKSNDETTTTEERKEIVESVGHGRNEDTLSEESEDVVESDPAGVSSESYEDWFQPFTPNFSRPVSSSSTNLPPTPPSNSPPSALSQSGIFRYNNRSPHTISPTEILISPKSLSLSDVPEAKIANSTRFSRDNSDLWKRPANPLAEENTVTAAVQDHPGISCPSAKYLRSD